MKTLYTLCIISFLVLLAGCTSNNQNDEEKMMNVFNNMKSMNNYEMILNQDININNINKNTNITILLDMNTQLSGKGRMVVKSGGALIEDNYYEYADDQITIYTLRADSNNWTIMTNPRTNTNQSTQRLEKMLPMFKEYKSILYNKRKGAYQIQVDGKVALDEIFGEAYRLLPSYFQISDEEFFKFFETVSYYVFIDEEQNIINKVTVSLNQNFDDVYQYVKNKYNKEPSYQFIDCSKEIVIKNVEKITIEFPDFKSLEGLKKI